MTAIDTSFPGIRRFRCRSGRLLEFGSIGLGSAPLGNQFQAIDDAQARATLETAWDAGIRYYDTAPLYGFGLAETRLGAFLRERPRADYLLSTKIGRVLQRCGPTERDGVGMFFDVPSRRIVYDYSYDGVMRSFEASFERLGADRIDILLCHDIDVLTHGPETAAQRTREFLDGGARALVDLRSQGVVSAVGLGVNEWQVCETVARNADVDLFLVAGRYTLLEQEPLDSFLPLCERQKMGVIVGSPFNSGILATGPTPGARFDYVAAPAGVMEKARRIEAVCRAHGVGLRDAAIQFPLHHPAVVSVLFGAITPQEVDDDLASVRRPIPDALWQDLVHQGLLREDAPTGRSGPAAGPGQGFARS